MLFCFEKYINCRYYEYPNTITNTLSFPNLSDNIHAGMPIVVWEIFIIAYIIGTKLWETPKSEDFTKAQPLSPRGLLGHHLEGYDLQTTTMENINDFWSLTSFS